MSGLMAFGSPFLCTSLDEATYADPNIGLMSDRTGLPRLVIPVFGHLPLWFPRVNFEHRTGALPKKFRYCFTKPLTSPARTWPSRILKRKVQACNIPF